MPRHLTLVAAALLLGVPLPLQVVRAAAATGVLAEPDAGVSPLIALIAHARHSLDGEAAALNDRPVIAALEAAASRRVPVRLILAARPTASIARALAGSGVQLRSAPIAGGYLIADHTRTWIGSMDWSDAAFAHRRGFVAGSTDATVSRQAGAVFSADWSGHPLRGGIGALVVSAINARAALAQMVRRARKSLDLATAMIDDGAMETLLATARQRGVHVRVIGAGNLARLRAKGVQAGQGRLSVAGTAIVADGQIAFIGGQALTSAGLDRGRAVGVILHDQAAAAVERIFVADLAGDASPPSPISTATPIVFPTGTATASPPPPSATATPTPLPPTATATITSTPQTFTVTAAISPNPVPNGGDAMLTAYSVAGASCTAVVVYGGSTVPAYTGDAQVAPATGAVFWQWRVVTATTGGLATVTCSYQGVTVVGRGTFIVSH